MRWRELSVWLFMLFALAACNSGGSGDGLFGSLRITGVTPDAALEGQTVTITYAGADSPQIVFRGVAVEGTPVEGSPNSLSFVVPADATSGPLYLQSGSKVSNSVWFHISEASVVTPASADVVTDELGNPVAVNQVLVSLLEGFDTPAEADRIAALVGGEVIGRIPLLAGYQIRLDSTTLEELYAYIEILEADGAVEFVLTNTFLPGEALDWSGDPDYEYQRDNNRVEQGAELYRAEVHPTEEGKIRPVFCAIGIAENDVDFDEEDFSGYVGKALNNISLYARDGDVSVEPHGDHGTLVAGLSAAELGDGGMAGLLQALEGAHGGFNILVEKRWTFDNFASTQRFLEDGVQVINWSFGAHKDGALTSLGTKVDQNLVTERSFAGLCKAAYKAIEEIENNYPQVLVVASAGNGNTDAGDEAFRFPSSIVTDNLLVVGAHSDDATPLRDYGGDGVAYSNYGNRVDIAAAGTVMGCDGAPHKGTSFAAPLVTATVAAMQSIDPSLSPAEIRSILRGTALPIDNEVPIAGGVANVFTAPLTEAEVGSDTTRLGKGARLDVEAALQAVIDRRNAGTVPEGTPVVVEIDEEDVTKKIEVALPEGTIYNKVDILFLVDVSGSYGNDLAQFKAQAADIVTAFESAGTDVAVGVASFSDFPIGSYGSEGSGDYAYRLDRSLTTDADAVIAAINALSLKYGADGPESQLEALYQAATGAGRTVPDHPAADVAASNVGWRSGALPLIFLATDASFHDSGDEPAYPGASWDETVAALNNKKIRVYGLQAGGSIGDVGRIVEQTGGEEFTLSSDSAEIVAAVEEALENASQGVKVALKKIGDFAEIIKKISPESYTDVLPGETLVFDVTFCRGLFGDSKEEHVISFRLEVEAEDVAILQEIPVTVIVK